MFRLVLVGLCLLTVVACEPTDSKETSETPQGPIFQGLSLLGDSLFSAPPSDKALARIAEKDSIFHGAPTLENRVWVGRFIAYSGQYRQAIDWYTESLSDYHHASVLYRHRGHRYISVREIDSAIADFEEAARLIEGEENTVEPDGAPNPQGIPVSTRHGNIWYHLGLAYYLDGQYEKALGAYQNCLNGTLSNDDNLVSATHWITLILARLGRAEEATPYLAAITDSLQVIENHSYWRTCQFYKGELTADSLFNPEAVTPSGLAEGYGVAAWTLYQQGPEAAKVYYDAILGSEGWAAFGYIAAEADVAKGYLEE